MIISLCCPYVICFYCHIDDFFPKDHFVVEKKEKSAKKRLASPNKVQTRNKSILNVADCQ